MAVPYGFTVPQATTPAAPDSPPGGSAAPQASRDGRFWGGFIQQFLSRLGHQWPPPLLNETMEERVRRWNVGRQEDGEDDGLPRQRLSSTVPYGQNNPIFQRSLPPPAPGMPSPGGGYYIPKVGVVPPGDPRIPQQVAPVVPQPVPGGGKYDPVVADYLARIFGGVR